VEDRPTAEELLDAIATLLEDEVLPVVSGPLQHKVRVAGNLSRILQREVRLGPANAERERLALAFFLGVDPQDNHLEDLNDRVAAELRRADDDETLARAFEILLPCVIDKVGVDKPGYARPNDMEV
jgi:hypothetical protein